jgi:receptor protein-tyrosine kinase
MNTIELAALRLQQLERSGVDVSRSRLDALHSNSRVGTVANGAKFSTSKPDAVLEDLPGQPSPATGTVDTSHRVARKSDNVTLDLERLEETGLIVSTNSRSTMAEQFRHIKRPLLDNARKGRLEADDRSSLIMVTSALPGEGKTFCSINLAFSMAVEVDTSVLLVDADVVRCNLLRSLGIQPRKGLMDLLKDPHLDLSDVLLRTNVPRLSLLPAGTANVHSTELLASDAMDKLLGEIAARYSDRVVIFDSTPLLLTSEAKVLASYMGQILVVAEESKTPSTALQQAFESIEHCPCVMSVLNKGVEPMANYGSYYA